VQKANIKHNNKYKEGYGEVVYIDCFTPIKILCPEDGWFDQKPSDHLQGNGCQKCGRRSLQKSQRSSPEYFLQSAQKIHGDKYQYPDLDTSYVNAKTPIHVLCYKHGSFEQTPDTHLSGSGCPECGKLIISSKLTKWTHENFIEACIKKHNSFFDYTKTRYKQLNEHITIICPNHGEFEQVANSHLRYGCFKCASEARGVQRRLGLQEFIDAANTLHELRYNYSKFEYTNYTTPSTIICSEHGEFEQTPAHHLRKRTFGGDCPQCARKSYSKEQIQWLKSLEPLYPNIQYATKGGEHRIGTTRKHADGYDPDTKTVFEFQGCYYHGCERCFPERETMNNLVKKTFQQLFDRTREKERIARSLGYQYIELWQCDWRNREVNTCINA
jgi:hypothetical protein